MSLMRFLFDDFLMQYYNFVLLQSSLVSWGDVFLN